MQKKGLMHRFFLIILVFALFSCSSENNGPPKVVIGVSIVPQQYLVSGIADSLVDIVVMVPPGASPATWEATPSQMQMLSEAAVYFRIGHIGFERAWMPKITEIYQDMKIVDLSEGLKLRSMDFMHGDHQHSGVDPHTWMSPARMEEMARTIFFEMQLIFPDQKDFLRQNYAQLMQEIKNTASGTKRMLEAHKGKTFLIFHPSLGYLADDYGLIQSSIEDEGKEPSAMHMKDVIDLARSEGIKVIFVQEEFDKRNAEIIAREIGGKVIQINPLSASWAAEIKKISTALNNSF